MLSPATPEMTSSATASNQTPPKPQPPPHSSSPHQNGTPLPSHKSKPSSVSSESNYLFEREQQTSPSTNTNTATPSSSTPSALPLTGPNGITLKLSFNKPNDGIKPFFDGFLNSIDSTTKRFAKSNEYVRWSEQGAWMLSISRARFQFL
jgi:hypothetical protein